MLQRPSQLQPPSHPGVSISGGSGGSTSATTTDQSETSVKVYGATIGPLVGLIATTDERLQTITMVGEQSLIDMANGFLDKLDIKQKQVALSVKVLDVNLSDKNSSLKDYVGRLDDLFVVGNQGKIKSAIGPFCLVFQILEIQV